MTKKIISILLVVVLLVALSVTFIACDSDELKKLTYTDENGVEQTINIKKTADADTVTAALVALAEKDIDKSDLAFAGLFLNVNGAISGMQDDAEFAYDVNAGLSLEVGIGAYEETLESLVNAIGLYANINIGGNLPIEAMMVDTEEDPTAVRDFTKISKLDENFSIYLDESTIYTKGTLSEDTLAVTEDIFDLSSFSGKTTMIPLAPIIKVISSFLSNDKLSSVFATVKDIKGTSSIYDIVANAFAAKDNDDEATTQEEKDQAAAAAYKELYAFVKTMVTALNIEITKTKGSTVTFSMKIDKNSLEFLNLDEELAGFDGSCDINVTIDAKTMLDISISANISDIAAYAIKCAGTDISINSSNLTITAVLKTTGSVTKLSQEDKDAAEQVELPIMSLLSLIMK